jgi:hypothetical protein
MGHNINSCYPQKRNGNPGLFAARTDDDDDQRRRLAQSVSSAELDGKIKKLTSSIEAGFLSRARVLDEFAQLRGLLNAQLARARTLADELPPTYLAPGEALPIAHPKSEDDWTRLSE